MFCGHWQNAEDALPSLVPYPSYLLHVMPSINIVPTDFTLTITVRSGDTLSSIAKGCDTTVADIQRVNGLGWSTRIDAGQTLKVPESRILLAGDCD